MNKKLLTIFACVLFIFGFCINVSAGSFVSKPIAFAEVNADDASADEGTTETININELDVETSSNSSTAGDITEDKTLESDNFSVIISPKLSGSTNTRFWATENGPELRVYNGTITVKAAAGKMLNKVVFGQTQWGTMTADAGVLDGQTWTGEAETVVFTVTKQCRITSISATVADASAAAVTEIANIADLRKLSDGTSVKLSLKGTKVTVNELNMRGKTILIEDESGAIGLVSSMFEPGIADVLPDAFGSAGVVLNGYLYCTYMNDGYGTIGLTTSDKTSESEIEVTQAEIEPTVMTVSEACDESNDCRYVEFRDVNMVYDEAAYEYSIVQGDGKITLIDSYRKMDYDDEYRMIVYNNLKYIKGIVVSIGDGKFWFNPIGNPAFEAESATAVTEVANIADLRKLSDGTSVKLTLKGTKVTVNELNMRGKTILIEDESGAIGLVSSMFEPGIADVLPDAFGSAGVVLNGYLYCTYMNDGYGTIGLTTSDKTSESEIEVTQAEIEPTVMTVSEACDESNDCRYVEFRDVNMVYDEAAYEYSIVQGDGKIVLIDAYQSMDYDDDYRMIVYDNLKYIRGIVVSIGDGKFWFNPIGDPAFEVDGTSGINGIDAENGLLKSNVYSIDGVMVRKAGESLNGLTKGLYIVDGKKIFIK